ncbi:SpoIIE family protein phosphatase [Pseudaeromonas paramecii]|uniref:SpoIIE family protein phosphatase n=1 Tax=Pseudaeromonas paramecii TaxID=2138166 RepID=A0ABP8PWW6_9GAMM
MKTQDKETLVWQAHLPADFSGIRLGRQSLDRVLRCQGWGERQIGHWRRLFTELASRSVHHAHPSCLRVRLYHLEQVWQLEIEDDAPPFDPCQPQPIDLALDEDTLLAEPGWELPDPMLAEVVYRRLPLANLCTLELRQNELHGRILLIHHQLIMRTLLADYLSERFTVSTFGSAREALSVLERQGADLVISDVGQEPFDGLALRFALAEQQRQDLPPFLFLTGSQDPETRLLAAGLGAEDYLLTPVCKAELLAVVSRVLFRQQNRKERCADHLDPLVTASLRPHLPASIAPFGLSMGIRGAKLGGSDFIIQQGRRLILGDVMGRAEQARSFAHAYAGYLRGLLCALPHGWGPAQVLHRLAEIMLEDPLLSQTQVHVLALTLEESGEVTLASAGFPMPWLIGEEAIVPLPDKGQMTGLGGDFHAQESVVPLRQGERLLIHSDGLRCQSNDELPSRWQQDLVAHLRSSAMVPIKETQESILQLFDAHHADLIQDDLTLVLLERLC